MAPRPTKDTQKKFEVSSARETRTGEYIVVRSSTSVRTVLCASKVSKKKNAKLHCNEDTKPRPLSNAKHHDLCGYAYVQRDQLQIELGIATTQGPERRFRRRHAFREGALSSRRARTLDGL